MIWACIILIIVGAIIYATFRNGAGKSRPSENGNAVPLTEEDDLDDIELYIDELDENGEPW